MAGKRNTTKRLSCTPQSASNSIDIKARKRIEELFELTDEIINAYNEINDKYVSQIYRKYEQLKEVNKKLRGTLNHHHCAGCQCTTKSNTNGEEEEEESTSEDDDESGDDDNDDDDDSDEEQPTNSTLPSSTTNLIITRSKKNNPFIIPDIEDTQNVDGNDSRFHKKSTDNDDDDDDDFDQASMDTDENTKKRKKENELSDEDYNGEEEADEDDNGMARLPLALQTVIRNKAAKNKNAKSYLLEIPRYPALCEYLRDRSRTSFDHRPSEKQVRPLIENHLSQNSVMDAKIRMRLRDELREIHRSYLRTFMTDPHSLGTRVMLNKRRIPVKKSPM